MFWRKCEIRFQSEISLSLALLVNTSDNALHSAQSISFWSYLLSFVFPALPSQDILSLLILAYLTASFAIPSHLCSFQLFFFHKTTPYASCMSTALYFSQLKIFSYLLISSVVKWFSFFKENKNGLNNNAGYLFHLFTLFLFLV